MISETSVFQTYSICQWAPECDSHSLYTTYLLSSSAIEHFSDFGTSKNNVKWKQTKVEVEINSKKVL